MRSIALFALAATLASTSAFAGLDEGIAAFDAKDYQAAFREWAPLARQGNTQAQFNVALLYEHGFGFPPRPDEAARWYRHAADAGNAAAATNLGLMFLDGRGVPKDVGEAAKLFERAERGGDALAKYNLALLARADGGLTNARVVELLRDSSQSGIADATNDLATLYERGDGVRASRTEAVRLYSAAAKQGHATAKSNLERILSGQSRSLHSAAALLNDPQAGSTALTTVRPQQRIFLVEPVAGGWASIYVPESGLVGFVPLQKIATQEVMAHSSGAAVAVARGSVPELPAQEMRSQIGRAGGGVYLFGVPLLDTDRDDLRKAIKAAGLSPTREDNKQWYDLYDSSAVVPGSKQLTAGYSKDTGRLAELRYMFPPQEDNPLFAQSVADAVSAKYGKPSRITGLLASGSIDYVWHLSKAVRLFVTRTWPDGAVHIIFLFPTSKSSLEAELNDQRRRMERGGSDALPINGLF